jgi:hypothetical protein
MQSGAGKHDDSFAHELSRESSVRVIYAMQPAAANHINDFDSQL